ncbi:MAG TPA: hemerythrin family protein [Anaeromyxobacteraceae bacterium]|nr:hemerythrin family protein [Anaeromyxobacteraceae bacterium]
MTVSDLRTGLDAVDEQHRAMLLHMGRVAQLVTAAGNVGDISKALAALWEEAVAHFAAEEELMTEHAYPEKEPHKTAHRLFLEDLQGLMRTLAEQGLTVDVVAWASERVPEWLTFHIEANDLPMARYVARRSAARILANARGEPVPAKPKRSDA